MRQFDAGQGAALVDFVRDPRQRGQILVVPESQFDERPDVGGRVDLDLLGAYHGPAAFGLDPAHIGLAGRIAVSHAVAVRHLVEAVACGHRADLDRLEEDVIAGVSHGSCSWAAESGGNA